MKTLFKLVPLLVPFMLQAAEPEKFIYKKVGDREIELYVFHSQKTDSPSPAIVWFYGSGFNQREPGQFFEHAKILSKMGMTSIHANIRARSGDEPRAKVVPRCIEDAKSAFRWVRAHTKKFNLDPDRIAIGGGSSGGFLATAVTSLQGFDAKTDDTSIPLNPSLQILFNPGYGNNNPIEMSPIKNVKKGIAPAIIFQGTADTTTPATSAYAYQRAMDKVGSECHIYTYKDQPHGFFNYREGTNPYYYQTVGDLLAFLEQQGYVSR